MQPGFSPLTSDWFPFWAAGTALLRSVASKDCLFPAPCILHSAALQSATAWGWVLAPSMGYVGQGMIMGPRTAFSMLGGAIAGGLRSVDVLML